MPTDRTLPPTLTGRYSLAGMKIVAFLLGAMQMGEFFETRLHLSDNPLYWPFWLALYVAGWLGLLLLDRLKSP